MSNQLYANLGHAALLHRREKQLKGNVQNKDPRIIDQYQVRKDRRRAKSSITPLKKSNRSTQTSNLTSLISGAEENLLSVRTVFPFVLVTDTIKIDRQKLTIVHNNFLSTSQTTSVRLSDLSNVEANVGPFLGSIKLSSRNFHNNTQEIKYLRREDVVSIQRLLQGFMIAHKADIDTDNIENSELLKLLNNVGQENFG